MDLYTHKALPCVQSHSKPLLKNFDAFLMFIWFIRVPKVQEFMEGFIFNIHINCFRSLFYGKLSKQEEQFATTSVTVFIQIKLCPCRLFLHISVQWCCHEVDI